MVQHAGVHEEVNLTDFKNDDNKYDVNFADNVDDHTHEYEDEKYTENDQNSTANDICW